MLQSSFTEGMIEAGVDEAGRGCLAGPVFAAAVILPKGFKDKDINDSKQLTARKRELLRTRVKEHAIAWAVASANEQVIDEINILNASIMAMHDAILQLEPRPELLLIDGNRFKPLNGFKYHCIVKGDARFMSIAAASILAKTYRDEYMTELGKSFPCYDWSHNKGYPCRKHREAIYSQGICPHHRKSFRLFEQLKLAL